MSSLENTDVKISQREKKEVKIRKTLFPFNLLQSGRNSKHQDFGEEEFTFPVAWGACDYFLLNLSIDSDEP